MYTRAIYLATMTPEVVDIVTDQCNNEKIKPCLGRGLILAIGYYLVVDIGLVSRVWNYSAITMRKW